MRKGTLKRVEMLVRLQRRVKENLSHIYDEIEFDPMRLGRDRQRVKDIVRSYLDDANINYMYYGVLEKNIKEEMTV